jgi:cell division protein FtsB
MRFSRLRTPAWVLISIIALLQYPLWFGKGGWLKVWDLDRRLTAQQQTNEVLRERNRQLEAEVVDLKQGFEAIEERARYELGMIKQGELFFQTLDTDPSVQSTDER